MRKIAITSDCNAGLDYIGYDSEIPVLRSVINFGDDHYVDGTDIKCDEFYEKLKDTPTIPSTSAPTLGETMELIESLIEQGYTDIIHYPISFKLSGTGSTFLNLKEEYKDKINPLDIANMVLFLCSDKAGFITGENICIDGGQTRLMIYHNDCGWSYKP